jgi:predicted DNA-binding protein
MELDATVTFRISKTDLKNLKLLAQSQNRTVSNYVLNIIKENIISYERN